MSSKTKGWFIIGATIGALAFVTLLSAAFVQTLPRARVGVLATSKAPASRGVTLTVELPKGYGLTSSERREGWDELNQKHEASVALGHEPARVTLPPISYCTYRLAWGYAPPPPALFTLRLSDAPDETYTVWWGSRSCGSYVVRSSSGSYVPKANAAWKLKVGTFSSPDPEGVPERLWLLDVAFEPQRPLATQERAAGD